MKGETIVSWSSHIHPDRVGFMQVVKYMHVTTAEGKQTLYWRLANSSDNDKHFIPNISLTTAQTQYSDPVVKEITDEEYNEWLKNKVQLL